MGKLMGQTVAGFAALMLILGLVLFASAGSLTYWQAWLYLGVFAACVIAITAYLVRFDRRLLESRVSAGPVAETQTSQKVIQGLASLFFIGVYIVAGLDFRFGWSRISAPLVLLGDAFVILGFYIVFRVFKENSHTSAVIEVTADQRVISSGPYAVVRHPMYAGALLMMFFSGLALGSWVAIPFTLPLLAAIIARLIDEEKLLRVQLPGYASYCQKVRYRLIPSIW